MVPVFFTFPGLTRLALSLAAMLVCAPAMAQEKAAPFETSARQAFLFDYSSRTVLFEREADRRIAPGGLAKLMTSAIVFRELKEGRLKLEDDMTVSVDAWRRGGAVSGNPNMLLTPNKVVKVGELLTGMIVGGANDAALTLAQGIAGQEPRFVELMNSYGRNIGLTNSDFRTATGLAADGQVASLRDLVTLATHIIETYPDYYPLFAQRDFPLGRNRQVSRNPLLTMEIGADGLATGTAPETGQAIVGSAVQEGRRLIVALAGVETVQERSLESRKMLDWGFRRFELRMLYDSATEIGEVSVYGGASGSVPVRSKGEIRLPLLRGTTDGTTLRLAYRGPVAAPIAEGQEIARLEVLIDGRVIQTAPLVAARAVARGGVVSRAQDAFFEASRQWTRNGFFWLLEKAGLRQKPEGETLTGSTAKAKP